MLHPEAMETEMVQAQLGSVLYVDSEKGNDGAREPQEPLKTLTAALQQAAAGTVIHLAAGTYSADSGEQFPLMIATGITVVGNPAGRGSGVVIVGSGEWNDATFAAQSVTIVLSSAVLRGVTVTNPATKGTGIWIDSATPTIANCTLRQCGREGIFITGTATPAIANCLFQGNAASGIAFVRQSKGEVRRSLFLDQGFGIVGSDGAAPLIIDSQFAQNRFGLVFSGAARPVLRRNTIEQNTFGLAVLDRSQPDLGNPQDAAGNLFQSNGEWDLQNQTAIALLSVGNQLNPTRVIGAIEFPLMQSPTPPLIPRSPLLSPNADWFTPFVLELAARYGDLLARPFQPTAALSQADYAAMLAKALQISSSSHSQANLTRLDAILALAQGLALPAGLVAALPYRDRAEIPSQAVLAVAAATQHRLVVLYPHVDRLDPLLPITQAEVAAMIYQVWVMQDKVKAIASAQIVDPAAEWITFSDTQEHWAHEFIQGAVSQGWLGGFSDGSFKPDLPMSRAEYQRWLVPFPADANLPSEPNQPVLRIQVLQSLVALLQLSLPANLALLDRYEDAALADVHRDTIALATQAHLVVNFPNLRHLNLQHPATRAEIATMIYQVGVQRGQCSPLHSPYLIDPAQPNQRQPRNSSQAVVVIQPVLDTVGGDASEIVRSIAQEVTSLLQFQALEALLTDAPDTVSASADLWISLQLNATQPADPKQNGIALSHAAQLDSARLAHLLHKTILRSIDTRSQGVSEDSAAENTANFPKICLKVGYITGAEDAINLGNAEYRRFLSRAIAEGILDYLRMTAD